MLYMQEDAISLDYLINIYHEINHRIELITFYYLPNEGSVDLTYQSNREKLLRMEFSEN